MPTLSDRAATASPVAARRAAPAELTCAQLDAELADALDDARSIVAGLTDAEGRTRPAPESWSVAECLAHLAAINQLYVPAIADAVRRGRAAGRTSTRPFRPGFVARWIVDSMEPPPRRAMRAPGPTRPHGDLALGAAMAAFTAAHDGLRGELAAALGLDLGALRVRSPLLPIMRLSVGTTFAVLAAHERRHLWQARRARDVVLAGGR